MKMTLKHNSQRPRPIITSSAAAMVLAGLVAAGMAAPLPVLAQAPSPFAWTPLPESVRTRPMTPGVPFLAAAAQMWATAIADGLGGPGAWIAAASMRTPAGGVFGLAVLEQRGACNAPSGATVTQSWAVCPGKVLFVSRGNTKQIIFEIPAVCIAERPEDRAEFKIENSVLSLRFLEYGQNLVDSCSFSYEFNNMKYKQIK